MISREDLIWAHQSNILKKIIDNYHNKGNELRELYENVYLSISNSLWDLTFTLDNDESFIRAGELIDEYLNELKDFSVLHNIDPRSKFRSSFIEELSVYLFKDLEKIADGTYGIFNQGIYSGLKVVNNRIEIMKKNVDFCIGRKTTITFDNSSPKEVIIPIVAVEKKTYLDGTMIKEVLYSSDQIKSSTPGSKAYVLMETNQVGKDKILNARASGVIDEMFVLKANVEDDISVDVLKDYWREISDTINDVINNTIIVPGRLINI